MTIFEAFILGLTQGLTEFFPISSSAHLILIPYFLGWSKHSLVFDTSLHLGTAIASILYFWKDWVFILRENRRLLLKIIVGSIPAAVAGVILNDYVEKVFRRPLVILIPLAIITVYMYFANNHIKKTAKIKSDISFLDSLLIGLSQAVALIPGVSRSGITISSGFLRNISQEYATRFSFYLAAPIIAGAATFSLLKFYSASGSYGALNLRFFDVSFVVGMITSFLVGLFTIGVMMRYIKSRGLTIFVLYRILLVVVLGVTLLCSN